MKTTDLKASIVLDRELWNTFRGWSLKIGSSGKKEMERVMQEQIDKWESGTEQEKKGNMKQHVNI